MKPITVTQFHADFAAAVLPADASPIQKQEMKRAFFSGFYTCLLVQLHVIARIEDDQVCTMLLERFHKECEGYFAAMGKGPVIQATPDSDPLVAIAAALKEYHNALDTLVIKHGDVAADEFVRRVETALGMPWVQRAASKVDLTRN